MPSQAGSASNAGIVANKDGERHIPESVRADGSTRKAIKIRPGYRPAEDVEVYKNRGAENHANHFRSRYKGGVVGAGDAENEEAAGPSGAAGKNAKRRAARKKAKEADEAAEGSAAGKASAPEEKPEEVVDPEVEKAKKARNLKKKLNQAKDLKNRKESGEGLLPDQIAKVIKINELIRELEALGFNAEGEPMSGEAGGPTKKKDAAEKAP